MNDVMCRIAPGSEIRISSGSRNFRRGSRPARRRAVLSSPLSNKLRDIEALFGQALISPVGRRGATAAGAARLETRGGSSANPAGRGDFALPATPRRIRCAPMHKGFTGRSPGDGLSAQASGRLVHVAADATSLQRRPGQGGRPRILMDSVPDRRLRLRRSHRRVVAIVATRTARRRRCSVTQDLARTSA